MLSLLYNTGARVQELIDLTPRALRLTKPYTLELFGKGSKRRLVPLDDAIVNLRFSRNMSVVPRRTRKDRF